VTGSISPDPRAAVVHVGPGPDAAANPVAALNWLGARWSPAFSRPGPLVITARDCVLCGPQQDCQCRPCEATYENPYYLATGGPQSEACGMRIDPATGECPRGHRSPEGTAA
jgi:hypothetical protein